MRRTKGQILDDIAIRKGEDYLERIIKLEKDEIFEYIKIKKERCYGDRIYIELQDAFTKENTGFPYKYMFGINILGDPIGKYFISEDIYNNLKEASKRLIRTCNKRNEGQKFYSEIKNENFLERQK